MSYGMGFNMGRKQAEQYIAKWIREGCEQDKFDGVSLESIADRIEAGECRPPKKEKK